MKAMVPDGAGSVRLAEVAEPEGTGSDVLVAVEAFSINRGETFLLEDPRPRWRPGKDIAGPVIAAPPDIAGLQVGTSVVAHVAHSGWAERVAVPVDQLAVLSSRVDTPTAAALPLAGLTALRVLRTIGAVSDRRVLITGASGGVGHFFVELAAQQGARITALVGQESRGARLLQLGAERIVTSLAEVDGFFDVIVESVGGTMLSTAWRLLTPRGLFIWMGQASRQAPTIDFFDWTGGASATMRKFDYSDSDVSDGEDLAALVHLTTVGRLHPEIGRRTTWLETPATIRDLVGRRIRGNAVVEVPRG